MQDKRRKMNIRKETTLKYLFGFYFLFFNIAYLYYTDTVQTAE